jgi:hypothetical protein
MSETLPPQSQSDQPGSEAEMDPRPQSSMTHYRAAGKLAGKTALISGGDSGIGRAVAIGFAKEGADVAITWLDEREDAAETVRLIEAEGRRALSIPGDIGNPDFARELVHQVTTEWDRIDILVNNAAEQHLCEDFAAIPYEQVERTFRINILGQFWLTKAALPYMRDGPAAAIFDDALSCRRKTRGQDRAALHAGWGGDREHHQRHGLYGQPVPNRLCGHQGRHRFIHPQPGHAPGQAEHSGQCGGTRPDLDSADPRQLPARQNRATRQCRAHGTARPAGRSGAELHFPGVR